MKTVPPLLRALPARRHSLRTQLIAWNTLALAILLGGLGVVIHYTVLNTMMASIREELEGRARHSHTPPPPHERQPRDHPPNEMQPNDGPPPDGQDNPFPGPPQPMDGPHGQDMPPDGHDHGHHPPPIDKSPDRALHFDLQGRLLEPGGATHALWDAKAFSLAALGQTLFTTVTVDGEQVLVFSAPFPPHGPVQGVIQAPYPLTEVNHALDSLNQALLTLIPVALLFAGVGGFYLTDRVLRRVRRMTQAAGSIGALSFSRRLPVTGNDEFSELAETFNGLLGRLESAFQQQERLLEQQRRFTADASHELKTPLTIIKGNTSLALSGPITQDSLLESIAEIDHSADTMQRLVQDLLLLARSDGGQLGRNPIELLVRELLEQAISHGAFRKRASIDLVIQEETLSLRGNEVELVRLFSNLLENAVRATPQTGRIIVAASRQKGGVTITVKDTGVGIAPEHLKHLGERFYRVDSSRSRPTGGTGLGLSICKSIVDAHHGTMTFESALGVGTTVTLKFPTAE